MTIKTCLKELCTEDLEKLIDFRYERGASQPELDILEEEWSKRDDCDELEYIEGELTEDGCGWCSLEELLICNYKKFLEPITLLNMRDNGMSDKDIICNMRSCIECFGGQTNDLSDEYILNIGKELYENKTKLINKQRRVLCPT